MAQDDLGLSSYSSFSIFFVLISLLFTSKNQNPYHSSNLAGSLHHQEESILFGSGLGFNFTPDHPNTHICAPNVNQTS